MEEHRPVVALDHGGGSAGTHEAAQGPQRLALIRQVFQDEADEDVVAAFEDNALAAPALARGVKTHPLSWHRQCPGPPGLLLGYAVQPGTAIAEGVAAIADALEDVRRTFSAAAVGGPVDQALRSRRALYCALAVGRTTISLTSTCGGWETA
ncbi:hypothetical protein [Streptomyces sp. NPDC001843]|uniref:hypothetical protein n=1 Tax=Streptomyces sp. NPDC001843 TaxID=3364617 RepID=UPI0036843596